MSRNSGRCPTYDSSVHRTVDPTRSTILTTWVTYGRKFFVTWSLDFGLGHGLKNMVTVCRRSFVPKHEILRVYGWKYSITFRFSTKIYRFSEKFYFWRTNFWSGSKILSQNFYFWRNFDFWLQWGTHSSSILQNMAKNWRNLA